LEDKIQRDRVLIMDKKITNNEKSNIRTMATYLRDGGRVAEVIKDIKTGSYEYIVVVESQPGANVRYYVRKLRMSGMFIGTINIDRVSEYGLQYKHLDDKQSLPDSVVKVILRYNKLLERYLMIGEKALE
jgi:hypothetical protein